MAIQLLIAFILKLIMYLIFLLIYYCHLSLFCIHVHLQYPGFHSIRSQFYALGSRACPLERSCQHYFLFICLIKAQSDMDSIYGLYFVLHYQVQLQITTHFLYWSSLISMFTKNLYPSINLMYPYFCISYRFEFILTPV